VLFDRCVTHYLLYRVERLQFDEHDAKLGVSSGARRWSEVLGAEHFLRLLMRLPDIMPHAALSRHEVRLLLSTVNHFLRRVVGKGGGGHYARQRCPCQGVGSCPHPHTHTDIRHSLWSHARRRMPWAKPVAPQQQQLQLPLLLPRDRFLARFAATFYPTEAYLRAGDLYVRAYGVRPGDGTAAMLGALAAAGEGGGGGGGGGGSGGGGVALEMNVWQLAKEVDPTGTLTAGRGSGR